MNQTNSNKESGIRAMTLLRWVGWLEGISYLLLLVIAMPLKYLASIPEAVSVVGSLHGFAFVAFVLIVARVAVMPFWTLKESVFAMIASLLPAGTMILDRRWKTIQDQLRTTAQDD
ncbi:MAG: hypothetical protein Aurels2KO_27730 [Aureliella sp.]